jgi:hypothetical protein
VIGSLLHSQLSRYLSQACLMPFSDRLSDECACVRDFCQLRTRRVPMPRPPGILQLKERKWRTRFRLKFQAHTHGAWECARSLVRRYQLDYLLDESSPIKLLSQITGHDVRYVRGMGWSGVDSGPPNLVWFERPTFSIYSN